MAQNHNPSFLKCVLQFVQHVTPCLTMWLLCNKQLFLPFRADPLSNMVLTFSSKEDAIAFAEKNGKKYENSLKL